MSILHLPNDALFHVHSFLTIKDTIKFRSLNKELLHQTDNEELWKILGERDKYYPKINVPTHNFQKLYCNFHSPIGQAKPMWLIRYNLKDMKWETNVEALDMIKGLERESICLLTCLESPDTKFCSDILSTLLGIEGDPFNIKDSSPSLYIWGKPGNTRDPNKKILFIRAFGLFGEEDSIEHRRMLMKMILLISSTILCCVNLNQKYYKEFK